MTESDALTIDQLLFEKLGMTAEQALAVATDIVDEKMADAARSGVNVPQRAENLIGLLERVTRPETTQAIGQLIDDLPKLAAIVHKSSQWQGILAMLVDVMDDYQKRFDSEGLDVEQAIINGLRATMFVGSQVRHEDLNRIGQLLISHILDERSVRVVDMAARSLAEAEGVGGENDGRRIGLFGLIAALRKPEIQRSLDFGIRFAQLFGDRLEDSNR